MAKKKFVPRKRRMREHVLEDLSIHHVEGFILREGHTVQRIDADYGYDLFMTTFDEGGYAESGVEFFQVKAAESLRIVGGEYVYDLDVRDYHRWILEEMPVILVLFDAGNDRTVWLSAQDYFRLPINRPRKGAKTVRVRIPESQALDRAAVAIIRQLKHDALDE